MNLRCSALFSILLGLVACNPTDDNNNNTASGSAFDHEAGTISGGASWAAGTHNVLGDINVTNGVLEVAACSTLRMANGAIISVSDNGAIKMIGRQDCPITVTSAKSVPVAGDWGYLELYSTGDNGANELEWVVLEYAGADDYGAIWMESGAGLGMSNTTIQHTASYGMVLENGVTLRSFTGNSLINNTKGPIDMYPNDVGQLGAGTYTPNTIDSIHVNGGTLSKDQTWLDHGTPYVIAASMSITTDAGSAHLTLSPGVTLKFDPTQGIDVNTNGGLTAVGTSGAPITFTSSKSSPASGDWYEIDIHNGSSDTFNHFEYVVIEYAGSSNDYGAIWIEGAASAQITSCTLKDSGGYGVMLLAGGELRSFTGNTLTGNALGPVSIGANEVPMLGLGTYTPNTIEGIVVDQSREVTSSGTWKNLGVPYLLPVGLNLDVSSGSAHVTVEAGTTLKMGPSQIISVDTNAGLTLQGTSNAHVVVTSGKSGPAAGDWEEIDIYSASSSSQDVFTYTDLKYGGGATGGQLWVEDAAGVTLNNVTFSSTGGTSGGCDVVKDGASSSVTIAAGATPAICGP